MNLISITTAKQRIAWLKNKYGFLARHSEYIALIVLITVVTVINIAWIRKDTRPLHNSDSIQYLLNTFQFVDTLESQGIKQLWQSVRKLSLGGRPVLYQLIGAPFVWLFGRSTDAGLLVNILFENILLLSTYGIGKLVQNGRTGLLATLIVAAYPPIVHLSRLYMPHFGVVACIALSLWLLLFLLKTRAVKIAWLFGASLAFGALVSHYFVFHLPVPTVIFGLYMLLFQTNPIRPPSLKKAPGWLLAKLRDPFVLRALLPAALIAVGLLAPWYLTEGLKLFWTQEQVAVREEIYRVGFGDVPASIWWYTLTAPRAISYVFAVLLAIGLAVAFTKRRVLTSVLVVTFLAAYYIISQTGLGWYLFAAALPVAAVLTAIWIAGIRHKLIATVLTMVCVAVAIFNFSYVTWGMEPWGRPVAERLGAQVTESGACFSLFSMAFCPNPPLDEDWAGPVSDIARKILADPECKEHTCRVMVVANQPSFHRHTLLYYSYHVVQDFAGAAITVSHAGTGWWRTTYNLPELLESDYLIYTLMHGDELTWRFLQSPPAAFASAHQNVASFTLPWPRGQTARLIKRVKPLTIEEAEVSIAALEVSVAAMDRPEETLSLQFALLARLHARNGDLDKALTLYEQALQQTPYAKVEKNEILIEMGDICQELGDQVQAREIYARAIALVPSLPAASVKLAKLEQELGHPQIAEQILRSALRQHPDNPIGLYVQLGAVYLETGQTEQAIAAYKDAIEADLSSAWPHTELGNIYRDVGRTSEAIAEYKEAIRLEPKYVAARISLGNTYQELGQMAEAVQVYQEAVQAVPSSAWAHTVLGNAYRDLDGVELALAEYQESIRVEPDYAPAYVELGKVYESREEIDAALSQYQQAIETNPRIPSGYLALGDFYRRQDRTEEAIAVYINALQLNPNSGSIAVALGRLYRKQDRTEEAIAVYTQALPWNPNSESLLVALGDAFLDQNRIDDAIREFSRAVEICPNSLGGYLGLAEGYKAQGLVTGDQFDRVIQACEQALQIDPESAKAREILGDAYTRMERWDEALVQYQTLVNIDPARARYHGYLGRVYLEAGQIEAALAACQEALRLTPDEAWPRRLMGQVYQRIGDLDRAIVEFSEAVRIEPDSAQAYIEMGNVYESKGQIDEALSLYQRAIEAEPTAPSGYLALGDLYRRQGRADEAIAIYTRGMQVNPDSEPLWVAMANILLEQDRIDEATAEFSRMVEIHPDSAGGYLGLARAYWAQGIATSDQADRVIYACQRTLQIDPQSTGAREILGDMYMTLEYWDEAIVQYRELLGFDPDRAWYHGYLGQAYLGKGQTDAAMDEYQEAARLAPGEAWPRRLLGQAYQKIGNLDQAVVEFGEAVRIDPSEPWYHRLLAEAYQEKGLLDEAILEYQEAIRLQPDNAWYHLSLGQAHEQKGDLGQAAAEYQQALDLNPGHQETLAALERVRALQGSTTP